MTDFHQDELERQELERTPEMTGAEATGLEAAGSASLDSAPMAPQEFLAPREILAEGVHCRQSRPRRRAFRTLGIFCC
jgi:hypothetical protein